MGLDASVMCTCFSEGIAEQPPFDAMVKIDADGYPDLDLPYEGNEETQDQFYAWLDTACEHPQMEAASERIANWSGYRTFQQALATVGWAHFPTLRTELPETNGGLTTAMAAARILDELAFFAELDSVGSVTSLVDMATGQELYLFIAAYDGIFTHSADGTDMGIDERGFFIRNRENGRDLFRSMDFRQNSFHTMRGHMFGRHGFEFIDLASGQGFDSKLGVSRIVPWPDGRMQDNKGNLRQDYPAHLSVITRLQPPSDFDYIINPLRTVCWAAVETGNPIRWS